MSAVPGPSREASSPQPGPSQGEVAGEVVQAQVAGEWIDHEPKAGPSTTAADFDLEVFDSGSSCSLEDCFAPASSSSRDKAGTRSKNRAKRQQHLSSSVIASTESTTGESSENESYDELAVVGMSASPIQAEPMESACPSETEEAISDEDEEDLEDEDNEKMMEEDMEDEEDHCQCPKSLIALPPLRLSEAVDSNNKASTSTASTSRSCWKCAGPSTSRASLALCADHEVESTENLDEIVQDHDNFGTDENEDDSLDSSPSVIHMDHSRSNTSSSSFSTTSSQHQSDWQLKLMTGLKRKSESLPSTSCTETSNKLLLPHGDQIPNQVPDCFSCYRRSRIEAKDKSSSSSKAAADNLEPVEKRKRETFTEIQEQEVCCMQRQHHQHRDNQVVINPVVNEVESISSIPQEPPKELQPWLDSFSAWTHNQRLMAIDQLINRCHPTQVRHMMAVIEPQFQRDFISLLPKELALYVLSFLPPRDLLRAAQTCRYWRILAEDNLLWREKCREAGLDDMTQDLMVLRKGRRFHSKFDYSTWKAGYMRQHNIEINWRVRGIRTPKVLKGHDDHVITCLQFCNNRIVSGSDDNTLKVWNATTGKCLRTLGGHTGGVWSSQMQDNVIVSGSTDRTLKVWNADSGSCLHTLHGHTSTVRCMHLHGQRVVSGSRDATLRMWDISSGQCLHVLMGHVAAVRCVQYDGRLVVSGAYDYQVKVWNPETEECLHTLSGHTNRVYSLQFDGIHVVSGSLDTSIRVWDVETGNCKHALMGHQSLTSGMELRNNILVSGNADSTVKVWDITSGECLQTLSGPNKHQSAVTCLQFNSKFVITSSDDGTVKLWDVKNGEFIRDLVALESGGSGGVVWRIRANATKLVCAVGSRNGTEETKLLVLDFDAVDSK